MMEGVFILFIWVVPLHPSILIYDTHMPPTTGLVFFLGGSHGATSCSCT